MKKRKKSTDCITCGFKCSKGKKYVENLVPGKKYRGIICPLDESTNE
jgi:hypothetical protein